MTPEPTAPNAETAAEEKHRAEMRARRSRWWAAVRLAFVALVVCAAASIAGGIVIVTRSGTAQNLRESLIGGLGVGLLAACPGFFYAVYRVRRESARGDLFGQGAAVNFSGVCWITLLPALLAASYGVRTSPFDPLVFGAALAAGALAWFLFKGALPCRV
jgi:hypothetical protein